MLQRSSTTQRHADSASERQLMRQPLPTEPKRCDATCKSGQPCRVPALPCSAYCFSHDPERAEARAEARRRGGHNSGKGARLRRLVPPRLVSIFDVLEATLAEVHDGSLEPGRANAMANVARALVAVLTAGEMEERLRALEAKETA
jgi:hypothetical protein